jgi:hypothetical protein
MFFCNLPFRDIFSLKRSVENSTFFRINFGTVRIRNDVIYFSFAQDLAAPVSFGGLVFIIGDQSKCFHLFLMLDFSSTPSQLQTKLLRFDISFQSQLCPLIAGRRSLKPNRQQCRRNLENTRYM